MNLLEQHAQLSARAMDLIESAAGMGVAALCRLGYDVPAAKQLVRLATTYCDPASSPRKQKVARELARQNGHTMNTLLLVEKHVKALVNKANAWRLRKDLCGHDADYHALNQFAKQQVEFYNGPQEVKPARTQASVSNPSEQLDRTLHLTGPEHRVASLVDRARAYAKANDVSFAEALFCLFERGGGSTTLRTPAVIISIKDLARVYSHDGSEVILSLTDGSRMTGSDFIASVFADSGFTMLVDPIEGPVNLYRTQRFASEKQRIMAGLENPVCAWPGCGRGADSCQVNHNDAWQYGGNTNIDNLATCCAYHNGINDDEQTGRRRGYLTRSEGEIRRVPPGTSPPERNEHPTARGGAMRIV
ncbi:HNH endonuclease signature motif containing protein [Corynebacterium breve]|uniref:HNH endonuclease signature motif containing protein n=1 Tax=Corynebacterium breve TaxID=3049799 RepID=A0ABY8VD96_9CORY|nr:HNH endonuclease signature motif containing protein [Corynebacterium breve]WIM67082.1 HNH endonuclease signature motif containing protein [Corynebacterium breve]